VGRDRSGGGFGAVRRPQLDSGVVYMEINGPLYQFEFVRNLRRRPAERHQREHFDFALIQLDRVRQPHCRRSEHR
jgi:hypothetical protein